MIYHPQSEKKIINRLLQACVREAFLPYRIENKQFCLELPRHRATIVSDHTVEHSLKRLTFHSAVYFAKDQQQSLITSASSLLDILYQEFQPTLEQNQWDIFRTEIDNCLRNETLAHTLSATKHETMLQLIQQTKSQNFIHYIKSHLATDDQLKFFEQWGSQGHPHHPCHKTKLGFSEKDMLRYDPEYNPTINLTLAALHTSITHIASQNEKGNYLHWFKQTFAAIFIEWKNQLLEMKINHDNYLPIFIHPWQQTHTIETLFKEQIQSHHLILLPKILFKTKATLSFRTLASADIAAHPHIKLPVAVHSTSALRTVSPASVQNGPQISHMIKYIMQHYPELNHYLKISYEIHGLHVIHDDDHVAKHLSVIYRDNPSTLVEHDHLPIVVAALFQISPDTKLPLLIDLINASGCHTIAAVKDYFESYASIVLRAYFDLYLIYGISLEGHQQNTIAVFNHFRLDSLIARDLGGIRVHLPTLKSHDFKFTQHPNSATITNEAKEVTNKFLHSVIQCHLGEVIALLALHYQVDENIFWCILTNCLEKRFTEIKPQVAVKRFAAEYHAIMQADWQIKNLMRMRLSNLYSQYLYTQITNPLRNT